MSYENAPATELVATSCACCGRPLVDATSVETGVGPICREKHGFADAQWPPNWDRVAPILAELGVTYGGGEDPREICNRIVHRIACEIDTPEVVARLIEAVSGLGYVTLASRVAERYHGKLSVLVDEESGEYLLRSPYSPELVDGLRTIRGRRWDREEKIWRLPAGARRKLWDALKRAFPGALLTTPKGVVSLNK
jgi:hypothetical protein